MEPYAEVQESYRRFATEATDSPTFTAWALGVAGDPEVQAWIRTLPDLKQQPNLVFAAARHHGVPAPGPYDGLRTALLADGAEGPIRATILARATQTNEVGRLATLVPAFAGFAGPLALLEVGASAGLCLYPDRWGYAWATETGVVRLGDEPRLPCRVRGPAPLPARLPEVAWRGGIDLHPLDVTDPDATGWLETLVWPEQEERRARLRQAVEVARADPPTIVTGDLVAELPGLVERASAYGTVVVFHSAVIAYLPPPRRREFDALVRGLVADGACHWVSNEAPQVLPSVTRTGPPIPECHPTFVLGIDGQMVAQTHGHGRALRWVG
ncbi:DUF2332 domain-containing protein [Pimelobacter simplex]|uniref:DUF2332 domain-containing protein n=1 Tax=Nocardioides simplex TaxID=2045 RepID=UPI0021504218|nr:DUF2332 domain-containing protein [Pimelobacter simplex]UUW89666.1 DUF2332 domain-containing protein [Pimelobacter simplex]UUW93495.1 DUF2332 domain-containing protein [Pimelobacter simplex]